MGVSLVLVLTVVAVTGLVDQPGPGASPGHAADQVLGIVIGWTLFILGSWLVLFLRLRKLRTRVLIVLSMLLLWIVPIALVVTGWLRHEESIAQAADATDEKELTDALISLGYLDWAEDAADPADSGVKTWDRDRAHPGYTLIGSRERPEVYLIDMSGQVAHMWSLRGTYGTLEGAHLMPGGDLLVISKFRELVRLDWHSAVIWRTPLEVHHDVAVMPDGHLYTWVREVESFWGLPVRFPTLAKLTPDGRFVEGWSTREHLGEIKQAFDQRSFLDGSLYELHRDRIVEKMLGRLDPELTYDFFHPNTVQLIGSNAFDTHRELRPGNLVICLRNINQIATLDPETMEILWTWGEGELQAPHHPTVLENGNILVFDNGSLRGYSRVVELNPVSERIEWQYPIDPDDPEHRFFSTKKGSAQRLDNGNTLIGDGNNGRSVEVTPEGEIVWEFFHPEINELGQRAVFYRSIRYPQARVEGLIDTRGANLSGAPAW